MKQAHKNLFFSYRGGAPRSPASEHILDKQLEDNVTKALVYVLEHSSRGIVLEPFLRIIGGLRKMPHLAEVQFALQRVDVGRPSLHQRIALSIAPIARPKRGRSGTHDAGRPDAWIWCDESFAILVETKVRGAANREQIVRHIRGAEGWNPTKVRWLHRSWSEIYDFFLEVRQNRAAADPTTRLLVDEFVRYLRMIGLASDTTFDLDDFGYFLLRPEERDDTLRELLMRKLGRFSEELLRSPAMRSVLKRYGGNAASSSEFVSPGVFRKDSENYWITIGPKERRNTCHFTVRLSQDGISLEAFSPHKSFTEKFVRKIDAQPEDFIARLNPMKARDPYMIRLREAYYHDAASSYKGQRMSGRTDFLEVHPRLLNPENVSQFIVEPVRQRLKNSRLRPEIFLVRHFRLSELVGQSQVVDLVSAAAEPMLGYLDFAIDL